MKDLEFRRFAKIGRWSRDVVVTEKIDGTNACILIGEDGEFLTGCRSRWITPEDDNFGFSKWAHERKDEIVDCLGEGRHFGEWWGSGIQRKYGLTNEDKRFSLFNVFRWDAGDLPEGVSLVPTLKICSMDTFDIEQTLFDLKMHGSYAAPGFMKPEGIVVYHTGTKCLFKKTIENDDVPKGKQT